jgi:GTP-binding protein
MTTKKENYQLIDTAKINIRAGKGGDGKVSFRREKFIPNGGPDGGDGGKAGSVYFLADNNMETLLDFRAKSLFAAQDGEPGGKKKSSGLHGEDLVIKVPVGTLIYEERSTEGRVLVADMNEPGKKFLIAKGGHGGKGNWRFRSSTNQAPIQYTPGAYGEEKLIGLEIKLVADVGLIGFPNAGKSTLLNALTHTNVKVSNYPFTTLNPNLGTLRLKSGKEVIFADIPGLIEGASTGKGLGDDFLRHVERTRMLVHLIDPADMSYTKEEDYVENALKMYDVIRQELRAYKAGLEDKEEIILISKQDLTEVKEKFEDIEKAFAAKGKKVFGISAATGEGLETLLNTVLERLSKLPEKVSFETSEPVKMFNIGNLPNRRLVFNSTILEFEGDKHIG